MHFVKVYNSEPSNPTKHFTIYNFRLYLHLLLLVECVITLCIVVLYQMIPLNTHMFDRPRHVKGKSAHYRPEVPRGFQEVKVPRLRDNGVGWR